MSFLGGKRRGRSLSSSVVGDWNGGNTNDVIEKMAAEEGVCGAFTMDICKKEEEALPGFAARGGGGGGVSVEREGSGGGEDHAPKHEVGVTGQGDGAGGGDDIATSPTVADDDEHRSWWVSR